MGFDEIAVRKHTNFGWNPLPGEEEGQQFSQDVTDAMHAVQDHMVSLDGAADALHLSPDSLRYYMNQAATYGEDVGVQNLIAAEGFNKSQLKSFLDELLSKFKEAIG